jgi:UDP-2,4-diacetamido-2,4,6-trideoxy-beta-L-altropyranose hydrolase
VIRTDASARIGLGHLRRCATLGKRLKAMGAEVHFLTRTEDIDPAKEVGAFAQTCVPLDPGLSPVADAILTAEHCRRTGSDRLIVDHYQADEAYQLVLRDAGIRWLQFDGTASMPLWADWVVSMSPASDEARYRKLPRRATTRLLLGPRFAILRDEFLQWREPRPVPSQATRLLMTFGGGDDRGACLACLSALPAEKPLHVTILSGSHNPQVPLIRQWLDRNADVRVRLLLDDAEIARRMAEADIALTAGGTTTFETAMLGLPALIVQIADNQAANARAWQRAGVAVDMGTLEHLDPAILRNKLVDLASDADLRQRMADLGKACVDGHGAERIAGEIYSNEGMVS